MQLVDHYISSGLTASEIYDDLKTRVDEKTLDFLWKIPRNNINNFVASCINHLDLRQPFVDLGCGRRSLKPEIYSGFGKDVVFLGIDHFIYFEGTINKNFLPDIQARAENLPIASSSVGTVFCLELLEHVKNVQIVLGEIHRILARGGYLILSTPGVNFPKHERLPFQTDYRRLNEGEIRRALTEHGFKDIKIRDAKIGKWQINIFSTSVKA